MHTRVDADHAALLELEIARGRLQSIVDEAGVVLVRTAFSQIVREGRDFACALLTPEGKTIVQASSIPVFLGTATHTAQRLLQLMPEAAWKPGVVIGTNDIWLGTGHLYDLTLMSPIFVRDELVALSSVVVHVPDIGGRGWGRESRQVFEEGFQIPPMRLGTTNGLEPLLVALLRANVRLPDEVMGDVEAGINAGVAMGIELESFCAEFGAERFLRVCSDLEARTETIVRSRIAQMPAGIYTASFDSDPVGGVGFHLQLAITVTVDSIVVDFAGSSPQVPFGINACLAYARAYAIYGLKCLLAPELPLNEGAVRPILVVAPEGSIVNSRFPAAGTARHLVGMHIPALIFEALADAMPTAVTGECGAPPPILSISGVEVEGGALFGAWLEVHSGFGGRASADGGSVLGFPANTQMASIEMTEATSPLLFKCRELLPDSAGEGRFRGGLGQRVAVESLAHRAYAAILLEPNAPRGVHGGRSGTGARALLGDVEIDDYSVPIELKPGEVLTIESAGGGGYGDPITRPADAMRRDTEDGYISEEEA